MSTIYNYALNNFVVSALCIADQFFSHVNKEGVDSPHQGFILLINLFSKIPNKNKKLPVLLSI
jgi:hypothetical protein